MQPLLRLHWRRVLLAVLLLWLLVSSILVLWAYKDLTRGRDQLLSLKSDAIGADLQSIEIGNQLESAHSSLQSGHQKLASPVVAPFRLVPFAGRQLSSAIALSGTAATLTDIATSSLVDIREIADTLKEDRAGALANLARITGEADVRLQGVSLGPSEALLPQLADARIQIGTQLIAVRDGLHKASAGSNALASLLNEPSRYLVVAANPGEMRSGAGMFLSVGTLDTGAGKFTLGDIETVGKLNLSEGSVPWPKDMEDRWGWIGIQSDMRNLMMSPRFDQSAPLAAEVWKQAGRGEVDGVLVINPITLQSILRATGPVQAGTLKVDANNVVQQLMVEQYRIINLDQSTIAAQEARREGLAGVASATFAALNSGNWNPVVMAREIGKAANARHILVWSKDAERNQQWVEAGVGGVMEPDSLMLSSINVGANKVDQYLDTRAVLDQRVGAKGTDISIKVTIKNNTPLNAPRYVLGPAPNTLLATGEYSGLLTLNAPGDARDLRFDGDQDLVALGQDGPNQVISTNVRVKAGESVTYTLRFTRAPTAKTTVVESAGRYPATTWLSGTEEWNDHAQHRLSH